MIRGLRGRSSGGARARGAFTFRGAFTLIELLLVVTIIAVLCGILFAVIHYALGRAGTVRCIASLHQAHSAFVLYVSDNGGFLPPRIQVTPAGGVKYWGPTWFDAVYPYAPAPEVWHCAADSPEYLLTSMPDAPYILDRDPDGTTNSYPREGSSYVMEMYLPPSVGPALRDSKWPTGLQPAYKWVHSSDPDLAVLIPYDVEKPIAWADAASNGIERALLFDHGTNTPVTFHVLFRYDNNGVWRNATKDLSDIWYNGRAEAWRHPCDGKGPGAIPQTKGMGRNVLFFDGRVGTFTYQECKERDWSRL